MSEDGDFTTDYSYSANLVINNDFIVQISGNPTQATFDGVADSADCYWNDESNQDKAFEEIDNKELEAALVNEGFENNIGWLEDNSTDIINPDNAKYRHDNSDTE